MPLVVQITENPGTGKASTQRLYSEYKPLGFDGRLQGRFAHNPAQNVRDVFLAENREGGQFEQIPVPAEGGLDRTVEIAGIKVRVFSVGQE